MDATIETPLTPAQVAQALGVTQGTLAAWRAKGRGPKWWKLSKGRSGRIRYDRAEVLRWREEQSS